MEQTKVIISRKNNNNKHYIIKISGDDFDLLKSILDKYYKNLERNRKNSRQKSGLSDDKIGTKPRVKEIEMEILETLEDGQI